VSFDYAKISKKEDLGFVLYELRADDVVQVRLEDDVMIDLEKAKQMDAALRRITSDMPKKLLVLSGQYSSATTEAREFLASRAKLNQIARCSVIIHSLSQRILANFFIKVNKPPFSIRFFNTSEAAEKWLFLE
jgi:hypothetical protein